MPDRLKQSPTSNVRQIRWIVLVLAASNVLVGLFSVYTLRQADTRYTELIGRSVPVMNDLQTVTAKAAQAMVSTNIGRLTANGMKAGAAPAEAAISEDVKLRQELLQKDWKWLVNATRERALMQQAGDTFTEAANSVVSLVRTGKVDDATREREARLIPAFSAYLDAITSAADVLEAESQRVNAVESKRTGTMANLMLGLAGWPVAIVLVLLGLTAIFVMVLMVLFRGREMSDQP